MALAAALLALSMFWMGDVNLFIAPGSLLWLIILSGFAIAAIFVPMTTFSVATMSRQQMGDATGLTSLLRNLGSSVGISLLTKLIAAGTQAHQDLMVGHLTLMIPHFEISWPSCSTNLPRQRAGPVAAQHHASGLMYQLLQQQAALWAYVDLFRLLAGAGLRPALATGVLVQKRLTTAPEGGGHGALTFFLDFVDVRAPFRPSTARGRWRSSQPGAAGAAPTPQ
jgi:DHA2 family multidrug resistance protein